MTDIIKKVVDPDHTTRKDRQEVIELREKRKKHIQVMGSPPYTTPEAFDPLLEMCLRESQLRGFSYDLCVVPTYVYKRLLGVSATVPVPGQHYDNIPDVIDGYALDQLHEASPPTWYEAGDHTILMTYSTEIDRSVLIDMEKL